MNRSYDWRSLLRRLRLPGPPEAWRGFLPALLAPMTLVFVLGVALPAVLMLRHPLPGEPDAPATPDAVPAAPDDDDAPHRLLATVDSLRMAEAFLNARLAMAGQDEISLAVDLVDRVLYLEVEGVPVRRASILRYGVSARLDRARRQGRLAPWLAEPFTLERAAATLAKAPVRIVEAPRDTAEAQARPPQDVPTETGETHAALHFDRGLTVRIYQPSSFAGAFSRAALDLKERLATTGTTMGRLGRGQAPAPDLWIDLELAPADARAVYRALPDSAKLALRL